MGHPVFEISDLSQLFVYVLFFITIFSVTCYFIDHGDEDVLKVTDLRRLLPEFLELAPQAKSVRLAGLEDLAGDAR